ncbi:MAG: hypothetical protein A2583_11345 [Bdellovibrionales bacterium RIFOXYD1_FULL_53_11]|nr:MAG: hypothetical protein A2583_11345 [Bdellovibrionales bacterium RIFOXYD1_FULL_53_11]
MEPTGQPPIPEVEFGEDGEDTLKDRYLTFMVGAENYAIPISSVIEIVGLQMIAEVPGAPPFVKGVMNLRGRVIPVICARVRFGLEERTVDDRTCVIVVNTDGMDIGLVVDAVDDVVGIPAEGVSAAPLSDRRAGLKYIKAMGRIGDAVKIILDLEKLVVWGARQEGGGHG